MQNKPPLVLLDGEWRSQEPPRPPARAEPKPLTEDYKKAEEPEISQETSFSSLR